MNKISNCLTTLWKKAVNNDKPINGRPKLLIIQGAGCSIPFGMPSVRNIDDEMKEWSEKFVLNSPSNININFFQEIWQASERYYERGTNHHENYTNFESVLGNMVAMANWLSSDSFGDPIINELIGPTPFGTLGSLLGLPKVTREAVREIVFDQHKYLLTELAKHFRNICQENTVPIKPYKDFLEKIREKFHVGIYNLNYDNIAIRAWPEAYTGFEKNSSTKNFNPKEIFERKCWDFLYHLHGSVHFNFPKMGHQAFFWNENLEDTFKVYDEDYKPLIVNSTSSRMPMTTFLAGGFKLEQLSPEPFHTFHASLVRHVYEADAILIIGYGYGDTHVNWALKNRYRHDRNFSLLTIDKKDEAFQGSLINKNLGEDIWIEKWQNVFYKEQNFCEDGSIIKVKQVTKRYGFFLKGEEAFEKGCRKEIISFLINNQ